VFSLLVPAIFLKPPAQATDRRRPCSIATRQAAIIARFRVSTVPDPNLKLRVESARAYRMAR